MILKLTIFNCKILELKWKDEFSNIPYSVRVHCDKKNADSLLRNFKRNEPISKTDPFYIYIFIFIFWQYPVVKFVHLIKKAGYYCKNLKKGINRCFQKGYRGDVAMDLPDFMDTYYTINYWNLSQIWRKCSGISEASLSTQHSLIYGFSLAYSIFYQHFSIMTTPRPSRVIKLVIRSLAINLW